MEGWGADALVAWTAGGFGWTAAGIVRSFMASWPWIVVVFAGLAGLRFVPLPWRRFAAAGVGIVLLVACALGIHRGYQAWSQRWTDLRLAAPKGLLAALGEQSKHVFLNPSARSPVAALDHGLLAGGPSPEEAAALIRSPAQWRAADREHPFSAVLLVGRLSEAAPLIAHLSESPDWYLAAIDNQGLLFLRGDKPDQLGLPDPQFASERERAISLSQAALSLDAVGAKIQAARCIDKALGIAGGDYDVLYRSATLAAAQSRWERAKKLAAKALEKRPHGFEASYLLAWSLLETRDFDKAFQITSSLAKAHPRDIQVLILQARAARAAKDFRSETRSLESLLPLVKDDAAATARIHIYLGQSWAQRGFPTQALENFRRALESPLSAAEVRDVREEIQTIEDKQLKRFPPN